MSKIYSFIGGVLCLLAALYNTLIGPDWEVAVGWVILSAPFFFTCIFKRYQQVRIRRFTAWLQFYKDKMASGTLYYRDIEIYPQTELIQYQSCISVLIFSFKVKSRYYIRDYDNSFVAMLLYSLVSLLLGWWGGLGPIYTVQTIIKNFSGGVISKVCDLVPLEVEQK